MVIERKEVEDWILQVVKQRNKPGDQIAECGKCGAIKMNCMGLAKTLKHYIDLKCTDEDKEEMVSELLCSLVEGIPEFPVNTTWAVWEAWERNNSHRYCPFLSPENYDGDRYIRYEDVVLVTQKSCSCFLLI